MKQGILNKKIEPACEYCAVGKLSPDGKNVLCIKSGVRALDSSCSKFTYDVLKRTPKRKQSGFSEFTEDDFKL